MNENNNEPRVYNNNNFCLRSEKFPKARTVKKKILFLIFKKNKKSVKKFISHSKEEQEWAGKKGKDGKRGREGERLKKENDVGENFF